MQRPLQETLLGNTLRTDTRKYVLTPGDPANAGRHFVIQTENGTIEIQGSTDALHSHEIRHIVQHLNREGTLSFSEDGLLTDKLSTFHIDEIEAYQVEFSIDGSYPQGARKLSDINEKSLNNIYDDNNKKVY